MNSAIVSAAFSDLGHRSPDWYRQPAIDFQSACPLPYILWTQTENIPHFPFNVRTADPNELVSSFWGRDDWMTEYRRAMEYNPMRHTLTPARKPQVLGAWLGKFEMMRRVFDTTDYDGLLWVDAGCMKSNYFSHDASLYRGITINACQMERFVDSLEGKAALLCRFRMWGQYHMPQQWMTEMVPTGKAKFGVLATFFWVSRSHFDEFYRICRANWLRLISENKAGTEENAMALYAWEYDAATLEHPAWHHSLGLKLKD